MSRRTADRDTIDGLADLLSRAHTAVYVRMFTDPRSGYTDHDAGGRLFRAYPELKPQAEAYYVAVARELAAAGVRVVVGEPAAAVAADEAIASKPEATVAKVETESAPVQTPAPVAPPTTPSRKPKKAAPKGMF